MPATLCSAKSSPMTSDNIRRLRITVLRGGPSAEREVSLASGKAIADALRRRGHDVFEADIHPQELSALDHRADVIFPALHGSFGEDGTLQRLLEQRKTRFVGSGSAASAVAMDKVLTKQRATALGIPTPEAEIWDEHSRGTPRIGFPLVVKPVDQGSSVFTHIITEPAAFAAAAQAVVEQFGRALLERYIVGDELTVGILGHTALPPICIRPKQKFYDYAAKYEDDATEYLFDAGHAPSLLDQVSAWSREVFEELSCRHLARADWMVDRSGRAWFLEINTLPGFTSHSLVPKAAARVGIDFDELCDRLVRMALEPSP